MSYEIVYNKQFIKIDDKIIPLVLYGSNNCYTTSISGRDRRERSWNPMYYGRNIMIANTEEEIMNRINSFCGGQYEEHFVYNNKWVNDAGLIRFFKNGIKNAKTIEELIEQYLISGLSGHLSVWNKLHNETENRTWISSSEDLRTFLTIAQTRLDNKTDDEEIYICLEYLVEKFEPRNKKHRTPKERLTNYYAIKVNGIGYLTKLTSRRIRYCSLCSSTKQFKTEKEANKYVEKLKDRFNSTFEVEYIIGK